MKSAVRVRAQTRRRVTVRMIQSAIPSCEDSLRKHTRHAEDVVILRLIVCVSDVSNHRQTCGAFRPPSVTLLLRLCLQSQKLSPPSFCSRASPPPSLFFFFLRSRGSTGIDFPDGGDGSDAEHKG